MLKRYLYLLFLSVAIVSCSKDDDTSFNPAEPNLQATGSSSNDLLSDDNYKSLILEIVYVEGFAPTTATVNNFVAFMEARIYKPDGIIVDMRSIPSPNRSPYTVQEISDIEASHRIHFNTDDQIAVWAFFADGESSSDTDTSVTLGTAYRNTSMVIFEETLQSFSNEITGPTQTVLETTAINHEFGHILGLTNLGAPMQTAHEDEEHPKHCDVESCLMYFSAATGAIMNMVSDGIPVLDAQCLADLQANGGR